MRRTLLFLVVAEVALVALPMIAIGEVTGRTP